jgi:hypothetical protein
MDNIQEYGHNWRAFPELWSAGCRESPPKSTWAKNIAQKGPVRTYLGIME